MAVVIVAALLAPVCLLTLRSNLENLRLLRALPGPGSGGLPRCQTEAPRPQGELQPHDRLTAGRLMMLQGACLDALSMLGGVEGDESARIKAVARVAQGDAAGARDELLGVASPQDIGSWLAEFGAHDAATGDYAAAVEILDIAHELSALSETATEAYAASLQATGRTTEAVAAARELVRARPDLDTAHDALSAVLWQARPGDFEAIAEEQRALELRDYFPYHGRLGNYYLLLGQFAAAEEQWRLVLEAGVARFDALVQLGTLAEQQGRDEEAARYYQQALAATPNDRVRAILDSVCQRLRLDPGRSTQIQSCT